MINTKKIKKAIKEIPYKTWTHWQWYRDFFGIHVLRYLITWFAIVPVFANLLIKLPPEVHIAGYTLNMELPFKWECLWLSSFSFVIAYVLYQCYCPTFIKTYYSFNEYKERGHSPRWLTWEAKEITQQRSIIERFVSRMTTKNYIEISNININEADLPKNIVEEHQTVLYFKYKEKIYRFGMPILKGTEEDVSKTDIAVREIFWEVFGRFSSSKSVIRMIILGFLSIALILFIIAIAQNIFTAISYLFL